MVVVVVVVVMKDVVEVVGGGDDGASRMEGRLTGGASWKGKGARQ